MPTYQYTGYNRNGKKSGGHIEADNLTDAKNKLKSSGIFITHIAEVTGKKKIKISIFRYSRRQRFVYYFTKQISFMLGAGVPVVNALEGIGEQLESPEEQRVVDDIKERIKEGESFSESLSHHSEYFNRLYVNTVRAGELSGNLSRVFGDLADHFERTQKIIGDLKASLTYPIFMLFFAFIVVVFLVTFIVPSFSSLFEQFGQKLPVPTRILLGFSSFISNFWWLIIIVLAIISLLLRKQYTSNAKFKKKMDSYILKLPIIGNFIVTNFRIRFSYTMSLMIANGVGVLEALITTRDIFKNMIFTEFISKTIGMIKKGERFSKSIENPLLFPQYFVGMVKAGEMGDKLADVLNIVSRNLEADMEERIKSLSSLVEPLIIVIIGAFVGFVVLSIMLPIFQINQLF